MSMKNKIKKATLKISSNKSKLSAMLLVMALAVLSIMFVNAEEKQMTEENSYKKIVFAGGCFWCMEPPYDKTAGIIKTTSGYAGGTEDNPNYQQVASGATSHREAIEVVYDPKVVDYEKLLEIFWYNIDPLDGGGQFCDKGFQYTSAIFFNNSEEQKLALDSKNSAIAAISKKGDFQTAIIPFTSFYAAEDYHQDYYKYNKVRYKFYRYSCGRDKRLKKLWGENAGGLSS